ncbi:RNA polymerase sigma factor [Actinocrinis sp.]|uniref:RNA polymerase sigma factor n=1 Tax=Actinocrinis sp. TaxID=1920516 RepID=UPI002C5A175F|nr:sigma-70 family RNA polymerase sigma factor [Actinocrinis sp.]HXR72283.1 sigma-70 family RNA polymerase sigma factor [Actinocrinis sp.]
MAADRAAPTGDGGVPEPTAAATAAVQSAVADAHRREWAYVLAATARVAGDLDLAEECVQDAYLAALDAWTKQGVPNSPGAWLTTTARRRALDLCRRQRTLRDKLPLLIDPEPVVEDIESSLTAPDPFTALNTHASPPSPPPANAPDDRLRLIFTCCHPALAAEAQIALTLRLVCGLTTHQIAHAFLVSEATMAARVTRAKKKIAAARIPYRVPEASELPDRLRAVLAVIHLVYTTGHTDPTGADLMQRDLAACAIDLARMLRALMPDEREVRGLLALLLLTDARAQARTDAQGRLVLLEEQDRRVWNQDQIKEGMSLIPQALRGGQPGRYGLQAAIAALHAEARTYQDTDWPQIVDLYDVLMRVWPSPVVALNRAAARSMVYGAQAALAEIAELEQHGAASGAGRADRPFAGYRYLPAAKADLLRRLGRNDEAIREYRAALALTEGVAEREFLLRRLRELGADG